MKKLNIILIIVFVITPVYAQFPQEKDKKEAPLVLKNVSLIDGTGAEPKANQSLLIKDKEIVAIVEGDLEEIPADAKIIELSGKYLIPGLIDSHVHLGTFPSGVDNRAANEKLLKEALFKGITSLRDMAGDARALASLARDAKVGDIAAPDIYYTAVMSGPSFFADPRAQAVARGEVPGEVPWARAVTENTDLRQAVAEAKGSGATAIKLYSDLPPDLVRQITEEAHRQGLQVWAHAAVVPAFPREVIKAGLDGVSHFTMIYSRPLEENSPEAFKAMLEGRIDDLPMDQLAAEPPPIDELFQLIKQKNTVFDPTMWISEYSKKYREEYRNVACYYINKAEEMGIPHSTGTDQMDPTKPKIPLLKAIEMKVNTCGLTPLQAIRSATLYGAMAIGNEHEHGSIETGKRANLVVLNSDPTENISNLRDVELVLKNGKIYDPYSDE